MIILAILLFLAGFGLERYKRYVADKAVKGHATKDGNGEEYLDRLEWLDRYPQLPEDLYGLAAFTVALAVLS